MCKIIHIIGAEMIAYTRHEIISATDIARNFSSALNSLLNNAREKLAISKNNKLEAVLINIEEYEKLKRDSEILEYMEIYHKIKERKNSKTISLEESMKKQGISLDDL